MNIPKIDRNRLLFLCVVVCQFRCRMRVSCFRQRFWFQIEKNCADLSDDLQLNPNDSFMANQTNFIFSIENYSVIDVYLAIGRHGNSPLYLGPNRFFFLSFTLNCILNVSFKQSAEVFPYQTPALVKSRVENIVTPEWSLYRQYEKNSLLNLCWIEFN